MIRSRPGAPIAAAHRRQVQPLDHFDDKTRQMSLRKPLIQRRRHKISCLPFNRAELLKSAQLSKGRINASILPKSDERAKSDTLLEPDPIGLNSRRAWIAVGPQARKSGSRGDTSPDFQNRSRMRARQKQTQETVKLLSFPSPK